MSSTHGPSQARQAYSGIVVRFFTHSTSELIRGIYCLIGCFGFNGPLRQYYSLNQTISQREGKKEMIGKEKKKTSLALTASTALVLLLSTLVGRTGTEKYPAPLADLTTPGYTGWYTF